MRIDTMLRKRDIFGNGGTSDLSENDVTLSFSVSSSGDSLKTACNGDDLIEGVLNNV